jgi:glycosyltransferase involved in cell wall biosynthesis
MPITPSNGRRQAADSTRVLHLITRLDRGGSAENTLLSVTGLARLGYRVTLAAGAGAASSMTLRERAAFRARLHDAKKAGVRLVTLPSLGRRIAPLDDTRALVDIIRLIRRERPQIVHTHTSKAGALGRLAAWVCRVPIVVHTPHGHIFYGYYGSFVSSIFAAIERALGRLTDGLVTLTEHGKQDYLDRGIIPADRLHAIYSGVDLPIYRANGVKPHAARRLLGLPDDGLIIGVMGRLVPVKGHRHLIDAMPAIRHEFPRAFLFFVGDGDERAPLEARAAELGVADGLRCAGALPGLKTAIAACDVIVQPSLNEGMGRTVIEALAMGRPVVASRVGGLPELIDHGRNGLLVVPASPSALADAVGALLRDPARRRRMGEAARRSVDDRFSVQAMVEAIETLYVALAGRNNMALRIVGPHRSRTDARTGRARARSSSHVAPGE